MNIPTIAELKVQVEDDLRTQLGITRTWVGKVFLRVLASVQAAKLKLLYIIGSKIQKNMFADTADSEKQGGTLERFGRVKLNRDPYAAIAGTYTLTVTGSVGGVIPAGTTFKSTVNSTNPNYLFVVDQAVTLVATSGTITVRALTPGTESKLLVNDILESTSPLALVNSSATVASVATTPVDAETIEEYRALVLRAFRLEPQGGASSDYRIWASDVEGVRTVYAYTKNGTPYVVQVYVEALPENSDPNEPDGVPPASMISDVEDVIELDPDDTKPLNERGRRPLGAYTVEVIPVVPIGVTVKIYGLSDTSSSILDDISAAITELLYSVRPYIAGADASNKNDILYSYQISSAIFNAIPRNVSFTAVEMIINSIVVTSYQFGNIPATYGNYPYLEELQQA